MRRIICLAGIIGFFSVSSPVLAESGGVKLWPQLASGIYNHANELVMKCEIAPDGLTVTDAVWDSYKVEGCEKRWLLNMGKPMEGPLKHYKFDRKFAGLPVCITVELYNRDNWWDVKESYQEILVLGGGEQQIGLPDWFHIPTDRLAYDFDEGDWFPSGWKLPRGKYAHWQGAAKAQQKDRKGENPMYDFGFTHIAPFAMTHNGAGGDWARQGLVFGDNAWIPYDGWTSQFTADPSDPKNWMVETFYDYSEQCSIVIADFEAPNYFIWKDYQYEAFADLIDRARKRYPKVEFGCWGIGVTSFSFRIFDQIDEKGRPTGVTDLKGAKQWREKYNNPEAELHPIFRRCNLNIGIPAVYWGNYARPSQLYAFLQEWELAKLARPEVMNMLSTWIQIENLDGYPLTQYRFTDAKGKTRLENLKPQVPASAVYALSLFGHCVMDGLQCWEIGTSYTEELEDYSDWHHGEGMKKREIHGKDVSVQYYMKYFGFYNYHVLGMWQASQNKDIIEADTPWEMPELKSGKNDTWRVGDERYPSYVNYYQEPLSRVKLSADGKTLLLVASNPHNKGSVEQVSVRRPGTKEEYSFELVGDFPVIKRFSVPAKAEAAKETKPEESKEPKAEKAAQ